MEERRKHHHFLTFRHSSFDISSSSDIMRLVPGPGHPQGGAPGGAPTHHPAQPALHIASPTVGRRLGKI